MMTSQQAVRLSHSSARLLELSTSLRQSSRPQASFCQLLHHNHHTSTRATSSQFQLRLPSRRQYSSSSSSSSSPPLSRHRTSPLFQQRHPKPAQQAQRRGLTSAPQPGSGPIMERRSDRALPELGAARRRWLATLPVFALAVGVSALAIFNYEKANSSVVGATMYALRTHAAARSVLGDNVYFRDRFPWVWGELNQVRGRIDIGYGVRGSAASGFMRFKAVRRSRTALFETVDWTLELEDGTVLHLLDEGDGRDPLLGQEG